MILGWSAVRGFLSGALSGFFHVARCGSHGAHEAFHVLLKNDDGPPVEGFGLSWFALYDRKKNITISIFFYIEEICSALTGEASREQFTADTHRYSFYAALSYNILSPSGKEIGLQHKFGVK